MAMALMTVQVIHRHEVKIFPLLFITRWAAYRELLWQLILREVKGKYKQSILGYAWVLLVPLMNLAVLTIVFSFIFKVKTGVVPYPIYLFVGLVPWTFLTNAISLAAGSIVSNTSLITKIYLPREIFPLAAVLAKILDLALTAVILIILLLLFRQPFHWTMLLFPVIFAVQFLLVCGIALILSAIDVFFRDVEHLISVFLMVWMYLTPIMYSPEIIPQNFRTYFSLNPMTGIINAYRNIILYGVMPPAVSFGFSVIISLAVFVIGYSFFQNRAKHFADAI